MRNDKIIYDSIKNRKITREFVPNRKIPRNFIFKILDAGRWGPSILGFQPWEFFVIRNNTLMQKISNEMEVKSQNMKRAHNFVYSIASTINKAPLLIAVYNTDAAYTRVKKSDAAFVNVVKKAQLQAIAAAIQNMVLMANSLGLGICWMNMPIICASEINKILGIKQKELVAILALGYSHEKSRRFPRKSKNETITFID